MKNILYLLLFYIGAVKAQNITLLDSLTHYPISAVVIENSKGEIKGISNDKGQVNIANSSDYLIKSMNCQRLFLANNNLIIFC